ncbi:hypothetical protein [Alkalihalobacillus sp. CinArs1]|uniref:hypothetical protein n=1 Tax=Alkalihalobacillus sp. CinArs1 TaxID=2995314 RepID=UPI0022DD30E1|nr:hypothetical protein [Alkalihalobacillus sp. CinArs1]
MSGETLPVWFWIIYYLTMIGTIAMSVRMIFKRRLVALSSIAIILVVLALLLSINMIARMEGTELEYLIYSLHNGAVWAFVLVSIYCYILFWWLFYMKKR